MISDEYLQAIANNRQQRLEKMRSAGELMTGDQLIAVSIITCAFFLSESLDRVAQAIAGKDSNVSPVKD